MIDSSEVYALLELVNYGYMFFGLFLGFIIPQFFKLIEYSIEFLCKKLGKDKKSKSKDDEKWAKKR